MISISVLTFNPFQENTYVVWDESKDCVIIDAGCYSAAEERTLVAFIEKQGLNPVMALNTHGHIDHILGVEYVTNTYDVPFAIHADDMFLVESAAEHGTIYGMKMNGTPKMGKDLKGVNEVKFGNTTLQIIHTSGHTPGHISIFEPKSKSLFSGDTLFKESIGRTDLPGGDYSWIMKSILERIIPLGDDVNVFPGHGPKTTIGHEVLYNPFITEVLQGEVNPM